MAKPYSDDLRERIAASVAGGRTCRETAALFGVSVASAVRFSQRHRQTGSAGAKQMGGFKARKLAGEREWLLARIVEVPDLTLKALHAELADRGVMVSLGAVWLFFSSEGISFKKKRAARRAGPA